MREDQPSVDVLAQKIRNKMCNFFLSEWKYRFVYLRIFTLTDICHMNTTWTLQTTCVQCSEQPENVIPCYQPEENPLSWKWRCVKHISPQTGHQYLFFYQYLYNITHFNYTHSPDIQISWTTAQRHCHKRGVSLPCFLSKQDLYDFMTLLKVAEVQDVLEPEALYIGLQFKVCSSDVEDLFGFSVWFNKTDLTLAFDKILLKSCTRVVYFQGKWRWNNNTPAGFLPFRNYQFGQNHSNCCCFRDHVGRCSLDHTKRPTDYHWALLYVYPYCTDMANVRQFSTEKLYPMSSGSLKCTAVLLGNLAEPDMVNVDCTYRLLPYIVCMKSETQNASGNSLIEKVNYCPTGTLTFSAHCSYFYWVKSPKQLQMLFKKNQIGELNHVRLEDIRCLIDTVQSEFPPLFVGSLDHPHQVTKFSCKKLHCNLTCTNYSVLVEKVVPGYILLKTHYLLPFAGENTFECKNGVHINVILRCNRQVNCPDDNSDEIDCFCSDNVSGTQNQTNNLLYMTVNGHCTLFGSVPSNFTSGLIHGKINCFPMVGFPFQNDLIVDCNVSEEYDLTELLKGNPTFCESPGELPCLEGHSKCLI